MALLGWNIEITELLQVQHAHRYMDDFQREYGI